MVINILLALFLSAQADWIDLKEVSIDYAHFTHSSDPFLAPYFEPTNRLDLIVKTDFIENWTFANMRVHSLTDKDQYREVGLNYQIGAHLGDHVDLYFDHFSQHLLDYTPNMPNSYDAIAVKFYIYRSQK